VVSISGLVVAGIRVLEVDTTRSADNLISGSFSSGLGVLKTPRDGQDARICRYLDADGNDSVLELHDADNQVVFQRASAHRIRILVLRTERSGAQPERAKSLPLRSSAYQARPTNLPSDMLESLLS